MPWFMTTPHTSILVQLFFCFFYPSSKRVEQQIVIVLCTAKPQQTETLAMELCAASKNPLYLSLNV